MPPLALALTLFIFGMLSFFILIILMFGTLRLQHSLPATVTHHYRAHRDDSPRVGVDATPTTVTHRYRAHRDDSVDATHHYDA